MDFEMELASLQDKYDELERDYKQVCNAYGCVKTLDTQELENNFFEWFENNDNFINTDIKELAYEMTCITANIAICNPIVKIDKDKIVKVLNKFFKPQVRSFLIECYSVSGRLTEKQEKDLNIYINKAASEIILEVPR